MQTENKKPFKTSIGGQALIEGILMRGPKKTAIVVRKPDGTLEEKLEPYHALKEKYPALGWPIIRGVISFFVSLITGMKALMYSAEFMTEEEQEASESKLDRWIEEHFSDETAMKLIMGIAMVLGVGLALVLFLFLPTFLVGLIRPVAERYVLRNLLEGALKIIIFLAYLWLCAKEKDVARMFAYHGAEHKSIACYEAGLPLTVENVRRQTRFHPRCGTSFLVIVIVVSILVTSVVHVSGVLPRIGVKLLLLPLTMGISYEIIYWSGKHDNPVACALSGQTLDPAALGLPCMEPARALEGASLMVCFGGDGTILHAAQLAMVPAVPLVGVNVGHKGFIAELEPEDTEGLIRLARGEGGLMRRMMLSVELWRGGRLVTTGTALNDAVIRGVISMVPMTVLGDGSKIFAFSGDGLIAATPTGSTAYSMSAGGPLVEPTARNIIVTPISAHMLDVRSFVLDPARLVTVHLGELRGKRTLLSIDGGEGVPLVSGDELRIRTSPYETIMATLGRKSFYDIVNEKLGGSE